MRRILFTLDFEHIKYICDCGDYYLLRHDYV
jgi:hypothetical protein